MNAVLRLNGARATGWVILGAFVLVSLFPIWVSLKTALVTPQVLYQSSRELLPPEVTIENFLRVLGLASGGVKTSTMNFAIALRNSVVFTALCVAGQIFFSSLAAYAFARLRFFGRDFIFYLFLSATMVPAVVLIVPNFVLMRELGWINTFQGLVAPYVLMTPFAVFFLRQFFLSTPKELEEAARIDGASPFRIYWSVVLPVHSGAIATLAILLSINAWNEFFWPFLVGKNESVRVMAVALTTYQQQQPSGNPDWTGLMAATVLSIVPVMVLLFLFGRRVVESLQFSGVK